MIPLILNKYLVTANEILGKTTPTFMWLLLIPVVQIPAN